VVGGWWLVVGGWWLVVGGWSILGMQDKYYSLFAHSPFEIRHSLFTIDHSLFPPVIHQHPLTGFKNGRS
jgi:hypothetical protein